MSSPARIKAPFRQTLRPSSIPPNRFAARAAAASLLPCASRMCSFSCSQCSPHSYPLAWHLDALVEPDWLTVSILNLQLQCPCSIGAHGDTINHHDNEVTLVSTEASHSCPLPDTMPSKLPPLRLRCAGASTAVSCHHCSHSCGVLLQLPVGGPSQSPSDC